jgi:hypothetical protein
MKTFLFQPLSSHHNDRAAVARALDDALNLTSWMDRNPLIDGILFNEGHITDYNFCNKDSILLSAIGLARTSRVKVGACVVQLAFNDPKLIFERFQQLELMFPERFILGVGNGFHKAEGMEFGLDQNDRRRIADFNRDVLSHLMGGHTIDCAGHNTNIRRRITPDIRLEKPLNAQYFDSVGSVLGAQNAIARGNSFILNLCESEQYCNLSSAKLIFDLARVSSPDIKRYLFIPTFVYDELASERAFLHYYNLYRKLIYCGDLVDSEFLKQRTRDHVQNSTPITSIEARKLLALTA